MTVLPRVWNALKQVLSSLWFNKFLTLQDANIELTGGRACDRVCCRIYDDPSGMSRNNFLLSSTDTSSSNISTHTK